MNVNTALSWNEEAEALSPRNHGLRKALCLLLGICVLAVVARTAPAQTLTFTTFAGAAGGFGSEDGVGGAARFDEPYGVATDSGGNVYVADSRNQTIRKITPAGAVTTLAGLAHESGSADGIGSAARFNGPHGVAAGSSGDVYVADTGNHTVRKISAAGVVSTLAGSPGQSGSADGTGSSARFFGPLGVTTDSSGNIYVTDDVTIRKITAAGVVSTLAGSAGLCGSADGTGSSARFCGASGVAADGSGNIYVADSVNHTIRKITAVGVVSTLAGSVDHFGSTDGVGFAARFGGPSGVAADSSGNVYVADGANGSAYTDFYSRFGNPTIRKITPAGIVTTLAGSAGSVGNADGIGTTARFAYPQGVGTDSAGNVYVADTLNHTIRKITPAGIVTTLAGPASPTGSKDGVGSAARFDHPTAVATDSNGNVYVADSGNSTIRKISSEGVVTTLAGSAASVGNADGIGSTARFAYPDGVATDSYGNVYVSDLGNYTIRRIRAGVVSTLAGSAGLWGSVDGTGSIARFVFPNGVATDSIGNVYVADSGMFGGINFASQGSTIRKITPAGVVTTLAGFPGSLGFADGVGSAAQFGSPSGVAIDSSGTLYVADTGNCSIRKINPAGVVTTLAGTYESCFSADGTGSAAFFSFPFGVATDPGGSVYVTDEGDWEDLEDWRDPDPFASLVSRHPGSAIRKITPAATVTTVGGSGLPGSTDGTGNVARFNGPAGVATDAGGNIYVADGDRIRIGRPALPDAATIDISKADSGATRQLDTTPQTATSWQWTLIRQPSASSAQLSSASIRDPTFTPDVPDLYIFQLTASDGVKTSITTVSLTAATPVFRRRRAASVER